ncbi:MAG: 50S ribosomal protein L6 [Candidatus Micrarchaeota archaeon]
MVSKKIITETVAIPAGVTVQMGGAQVSVSGPKGKNSRSLSLRGVVITLKGQNVEVTGPLREAGTVRSHLFNMVNGSKDGYTQKMKVIYAHFPIAIEIKGKEIVVKNFVGEKQPRRIHIVGDTKVEAKVPAVTVSGPCKEDVFQTVANIRQSTRIKKRDSRIFQDGIYPVDE